MKERERKLTIWKDYTIRAAPKWYQILFVARSDGNVNNAVEIFGVSV